MGKYFLQDKMFKRPPELFAPRLRNLAVDNGPGNADVEQIKLAGPDDHITVLPLLERFNHRAQQRIDTLKQEADAKAEALKLQLTLAKGDVKARIEDRMKRVKSAHHLRSAKLAQAWSLTKEALAV